MLAAIEPLNSVAADVRLFSAGVSLINGWLLHVHVHGLIYVLYFCMNHSYSFSRSSVEFQFCMGNKIADFCIQYITRPVAATISLRFALYYIWSHFGAALHMNDSKVMDGLDWTFWGHGLNVKAERVWFWSSTVCTRVRRVFKNDYIFGHVCLISALWWPPVYFHSSRLGLE